MNRPAGDPSDTIVALATPAGSGAIGIIRLSGSKSFEIIQPFFKKDLKSQAGHSLVFGGLKNESETLIDEVLISVFHGPKSYTGEDSLEISCHGSSYILQSVIELCLRNGARMANAGEFTMRAFLNGRMDLSQAEAVADLIASESSAAHDIAMRQMRGGFSNEIKDLRKRLIKFASLIELELDFGEEDVEFADRTQLNELVANIQKVIRRLIDSFRLGNVIKNGVNTVIAGRPNAGKSTLLNALLNEQRAIVSDIAGTTRDTIEELININGIQFRLIDTAGIREAQDQIEAIGVEKTMEKIETASLLLYVFDVIRTQPDEVKADLEQLSKNNIPFLAIANKMDLNPYTKPEHYTNEILKEENYLPVSALNDMNIEYLKERLAELVNINQLEQGQSIVTNSRHLGALNKASESLDTVVENLANGISGDFIAMGEYISGFLYWEVITNWVSTNIEILHAKNWLSFLKTANLLHLEYGLLNTS